MNELIYSQHFRGDSEFDQILWSATTGIKIIPTPLQNVLHRMLAEIVETLYRSKFGVKTQVTSGQRIREIVIALKAMGYPVSMTTDHYFMEKVEVRPGEYWDGSTGAWDFIFPEASVETESFYRLAYTQLLDDEELKARVGQMIYYPPLPALNRLPTIHLSLSPECSHGVRLAHRIRELKSHRKQFLYKSISGFKEFTGDIIE